jgi:hypothetical protein
VLAGALIALLWLRPPRAKSEAVPVGESEPIPTFELEAA